MRYYPVEEHVNKMKEYRKISSVITSNGIYVIEYINDKAYVILKEETPIKVKDSNLSEKLSSDKNLFFSFIKTVTNKTVSQFVDFIDQVKDFKYFTDNESEAVIDWCTQHGLLDMDAEIFDKTSIKCISLQYFYEQALKLKLMYDLWASLKMGFDDDSINNANKLLRFWNESKSISNIKDVKKLIPRIVNECNAFIKKIYITFNPPTVLNYSEVDIAEKKKGNNFYLNPPLWDINANCLIEVLHYQFLCLFCNNKNDGYSQIRICIYCGCDFWGDIRSFYCPECKRSTIHDRYDAHTERLIFTLEQRFKNMDLSREIIETLSFLMADNKTFQELLEIKKLFYK